MKDSAFFKPNLDRLSRHLQKISRERNFETAPDTLREVQHYLKEELLSYGFRIQEKDFLFSGQRFSNLVASLEIDSKAPRLIVGAHFDSVPGSPGADDNATGVAALLEAARIYSEFQKRESPSANRGKVSVEFVAFNLEEYGMMGSQTYARQLKKEGVPVEGMLSLEMIGYASEGAGSQKMPFFLKPFYPNVGNFIGLVANTQSAGWLKKVKKIFSTVEGLAVESLVLPANGWVFPDARLSDHSPFWDEGFPALLVTDTSFYRNPYYHSEEDRIETLDLEFLSRVTEAVSRTIYDFTCVRDHP